MNWFSRFSSGVIPGWSEGPDPESRDSPMCNSTSVVRSFHSRPQMRQLAHRGMTSKISRSHSTDRADAPTSKLRCAALPCHICALQIRPRSPIPATWSPIPPALPNSSRAVACAACLAPALMDRTPSRPRAALWMAGWLALMLIVVVAGRETTRELNVFQIMEVRSVLGLFMLYPLIHRNGGLAAMKTPRPLLHVGRNLIHYAAGLGWFFALTLIPLGEVVSIEFTMPIWTAILAVSFLGERITAGKIP